MKLKILLVPFFLVLAIGLVVWLVMPKYYDDKLSRSELKNEQTRLEDAQKKVAMANKLMVELSSKADKQEALFSFLPEKQEEEEIINDLNNIASMEAVSIKNLTLVKSTGSSSASVQAAPATESYVPQSLTFDMDFTVLGTYDKIKGAVDRLYKLKRFNKISSISIFKAAAAKSATGEDVPSDNLQAKIILSFNYLKKADAAAISSDVFSRESFDMSIVDKINNLKTIDVLKVSGVPSVRSNPFLP